MSESLHRRVESVRRRAQLRSWRYRQRNAAGGVWLRLSRVLADAATAYLADEEVARVLIDEGIAPQPVGADLQPPKAIFFVARDRIGALPGLVEVPVRLDTRLLTAPTIVLVPFPPDAR